MSTKKKQQTTKPEALERGTKPSKIKFETWSTQDRIQWEMENPQEN